MAWAKIDDRLHSHWKVAEAGVEAMGLWVLALSWSRAQRTNGYVPIAVARKLGGRMATKHTANLVKARLWIEVEGGYSFHDFLNYNPSGEEDEHNDAKRAAIRSEAARKAGLASAAARAAKRSMFTGGLLNEQPTSAQRPSNVEPTDVERTLNVEPTDDEARTLNGKSTNVERTLNEQLPDVERTLNVEPTDVERSLNEQPPDVERTLNVEPTSNQRFSTPLPLPLPLPESSTNSPRARGKGNKAADVLEALNAARQRVNPNARGFGATKPNLRHIADRLKEGATVDDCLHVIAVSEAETRRDPTVERWMNPVTLFRPDNFARKLAVTVDDARGEYAENRPPSGRDLLRKILEGTS
jgi:hypothetical protein